MGRIAATSLLGLVLAALPGGPGRAHEHVALDLLWIEPLAGAGRGCARLLTAEAPRDWVPGDAAVILIGEAAGVTQPMRDALLREEAELLEYPGGRPEGCAEAPAVPVGEVLAALRALVDQGGAGLVVAIGLASYGDAVLDAASEGSAAAWLGPGGPRLAAAIAIDAPGRARFVAGPPPDPAQGWPERGGMLCRAVATAAGLDGPWSCLVALGLDGPSLQVGHEQP